MGESFSLLEALIILEQDDTQNGIGNSQETQTEGQSSDDSNYQEIVATLDQLKSFTLWFIPFGKQYDNDKQIATYTEKYMSDFILKDDATLIKMFNSGSVDVNSTTPVIKEIASQLIKKTTQLETSNEYQGFFALVTGDKRDISFYESL